MYLASFGACSGSSQTNDGILSKNHQCRNGFFVQLLVHSAIQGIQRVDHCLGAVYLSVSFAVNILLTLMIIARLVLHSRNIRSATRAQTGAGGDVYKAIITMLVESSALYAASLLPIICLWVVSGPVINTFLPAIAGIQVRVASVFS